MAIQLYRASDSRVCLSLATESQKLMFPFSHIRAHTEWTTNANNTFNTKNMIYTGQVFVPDDVNIEIDKVYVSCYTALLRLSGLKFSPAIQHQPSVP